MLKGPSAAVLISLLTCSCTHTGNDQQPHSAQKRQTVYVSQASMRDRDTAAAWLAYGIALATYGNKHQKQNPFDREVYARNSAAKVWEELKQKGSPKANGDLD